MSAFIRLQNMLGYSWTLGVNEFTDLTFEEFRKIYLSYPIEIPDQTDAVVEELEAIPDSID